jgi:GT2 family glycosyltransferase
MKKAAIVILNYNGEKVLSRFFPSIASLSQFPIVLIDNHSTDGSISYLKHNFPNVQLIALEQNWGYSGGYTLGLERLRGQYEYYILLNSDVSLTPYWDVRLVSQMEKYDATAAQPKVLSLVEKGFFDYAGAAGGYLDRLGYPFCRGRVLHTLEKDLGQYEDVVEVDWASGACFGVLAANFHELGGFDSSFFAHMEEIDLCLRFRLHGKKIFAFPEITVFHLGGGTLPTSNPMKTYLNFRNSLMMLRKNLTTLGFFKVVLIRIFLDAGAALHLLFTKGVAHAWAVLKAYWHFLRGKSSQKILVKTCPNNLSVSEKPIFSVIWSYYLKGKRTFTSMR